MISQRQLRCFLQREFPDCGIDFNKISGADCFADLGLPYADFMGMFHKIMVEFKVQIPRQEYKDLTSISKIIYYINNHNVVDPTFQARLRAGFYKVD